MWTEPVTDRTFIDVSTRQPKGFLNVSDLNRIEDNCGYLGAMLDVAVDTKLWGRSFPYVLECARINNNVKKIRESGRLKLDTPALPDPMEYNHFESINVLEQIIKDVYDSMWEEKRKNYIPAHMGELYVGEEKGVI